MPQYIPQTKAYRHITVELARDAQAPPERERKSVSVNRFRLEATVEIDEAERTEIERAMSKAMGAYITAVGQPDFSKWGKDEWLRLVAVAFNACAPQVLTKRVVISKPFTLEDELQDEIPF